MSRKPRSPFKSIFTVSMPPRVSHTKSRAGCLRCKQRRVKCDEARPQCTNCIRHEVPCQYKSTPRELSESQRTTPLAPREPGAGNGSGSGRTIQDVTDEAANLHRQAAALRSFSSDTEIEDLLTPAQHRQLELQLLHHFETCAVWTIGSAITTEGREIWSVTAVEIGLEHPVLQDAILAFAALHIVVRSPETPAFFAAPEESAAAQRALAREIKWTCPLDPEVVNGLYLDRALKQQQLAIRSVTSESAAALFLSTVLLAAQATPCRLADRLPKDYEPPMHWLRMLSAYNTIGELCDKLLPSDQLPWTGLLKGRPNPLEKETFYDPQYAESFESLLDWDLFPEPGPLDEGLMETYSSTLAYIGSIHQAWNREDPPDQIHYRLILFGTFMSRGYADLVAEGRPRALAIFALWSSFSHVLNGHWLWHGFAEGQISGIASVLPAEWQWAMEQPMEIVRETRRRADMRL